jgi:2-alkenal reductase
MKTTFQKPLFRRLRSIQSVIVLMLMLSLSLSACTLSPEEQTRTLITETSAKPASSLGTTSTQNSLGVAQTDQAESNSVVDIVNKFGPAVVTVYNRTKFSSNSLPGQGSGVPTAGASGYVVQGVGSGIIISEDGYIVTNEHVVDGQEDLTVALNDGKASVSARLVGIDKLGDLAVLKIDAKVPAYAKWADQAQVGETVIAIGSALGNFRNSVSKGVVSGLNRTLPGDTGTNVYVQTDAAINHGNSGGPLFNLRGEIVGINTAVLRGTSTSSTQRGDVAEGLGFAIPSAIARILVDQLISKGSVTRPYFGITYQMISPADAGTLSTSGRTVPAVEGAWVSRSTGSQSGVVKGGPADKAGIKDNDVIIAIEGTPLNDNNPLVSQILKYKPNETIKITVQRGDEKLDLQVTLGERPNDL